MTLNQSQPPRILDNNVLSDNADLPYYPVGVSIAGYIANTLSTPEILAIFASACAVVLGSTAFLARRARPDLPTGEIATILWFVLCGSIHSGLEGYFAFNFHHMGSSLTILGQCWKEYSLSDSRYLTQDAFVTCMELITAVCWGPMSFILAYFILVDHPYRHVFQSIISLGQLYGDVLYYMTAVFQHIVHKTTHWRPETYYFVGYFVFLNAFWIVIPSILLIRSAVAIGRAFAKLQQQDGVKKHA